MLLGGCLFSTRYTMTAEVYKKVRTVGSSGNIQYKWAIDTSFGDAGVIQCIITPFLSNSFTRQGTGEIFGEKYLNVDFLKLMSAANISRSAQIANIKDSTGALLYKELDFQNKPGTWYNSAGSAPVIGPFGEIVEYQTLLSRAEQQGDIS
jgi:hypothetical protein